MHRLAATLPARIFCSCSSRFFSYVISSRCSTLPLNFSLRSLDKVIFQHISNCYILYRNFLSLLCNVFILRDRFSMHTFRIFHAHTSASGLRPVSLQSNPIQYFIFIQRKMLQMLHAFLDTYSRIGLLTSTIVGIFHIFMSRTNMSHTNMQICKRSSFIKG